MRVRWQASWASEMRAATRREMWRPARIFAARSHSQLLQAWPHHWHVSATPTEHTLCVSTESAMVQAVAALTEEEKSAK